VKETRLQGIEGEGDAIARHWGDGDARVRELRLQGIAGEGDPIAIVKETQL
jgi:hypothetical protein